MILRFCEVLARPSERILSQMGKLDLSLRLTLKRGASSL